MSKIKKKASQMQRITAKKNGGTTPKGSETSRAQSIADKTKPLTKNKAHKIISDAAKRHNGRTRKGSFEALVQSEMDKL